MDVGCGAGELLRELRHAGFKQETGVDPFLSEELNKVQLLGWCEPQEVFRASDVTVVPSRQPESFGLVAAEAMAFGCPVIVSSAGALPEVVGEGYPWVFRTGDPADLANVIEEVERAEADQLVQQRRRRWENLYSPKTGLDRLAVLLDELDPSLGAQMPMRD